MSDTAQKPPPPPNDLSREGRKDGPGRRLWKSIAGSGDYALRPDELRILHAACRCDDAIAELNRRREEYEKSPRYAELLMRGSQGQPVENPLRARVNKIIADIQIMDSALAAHLAKLKLPDLDGAAAGAEAGNQEGEPRSVSARAAANSRWGKAG